MDFNSKGVREGQRVGPSPKHHKATAVDQQVNSFRGGEAIWVFSNVSDIPAIIKYFCNRYYSIDLRPLVDNTSEAFIGEGRFILAERQFFKCNHSLSDNCMSISFFLIEIISTEGSFTHINRVLTTEFPHVPRYWWTSNDLDWSQNLVQLSYK